EHLKRMAADRVERGPAAKVEPDAHPRDRLLLPLLLANEEARPELIAALRGLSSMTGKAVPLYETIVAMHEAGEAISFVSVHERLNRELQDLMQAIVLEAASVDATLELGLSCIEAWKREALAAWERDIKAQIRQAEREGQVADALALMKRLKTGV